MSCEFLQDDLGDFVIDGKRVTFSKLTPDQREQFAKEDWAFRIGYNSVDCGVPVTEGDLKALENPDLLKYFQRGQSIAMEDIKFINPDLN